MKKSAIRNGLLYAGISILIFLAMYLIKPELTFNLGIGFLTSLVVPIFFIARGIIREREENEGQITFGEGLITGLVIYFVGSLLLTLVNVTVLQVDSSYKQKGEEISKEMAIKTMEKTFGFLNVPEEEQATALAELEKNPPKITVWNMLFGFIGSLIFPGLILCLIIALVLKRK